MRIAYRQQFTRCGKQRCRKCKEGAGHGPYWYAYWNENGRTKTRYIGVHLPPDLEPAQQTLTGEEENAAHYMPARATPAPVLRVYLLGQFYVEHKSGDEWCRVDPLLWQHRRARSLLGCLLSSANRRLSKEQVMKLLWPDLDKDIAANRLNGAVHELRQILEPDITRPGSSRLLRLEGDSLELADSSQIWVDAEAFEHLLHEANATTSAERAEQLLEEADALYKNSYLLEELYAEWASQRRDVLQQKWAEMLLALANLRAEREANIEAIATLDRLRFSDPANETALQRLMVLLTQQHRRGEALRIYRQHASMLKREYECEPLAETRSLYNELRHGRIPPEYPVQTGKKRTVGHLSPRQAPPDDLATQEGLSARPALQPGRHNQHPLIGRQQELESMRHILQAVSSPPQTKHPHFVLLTGEAGIGKTRLIEELSIEAYTQGWVVAWFQAKEQERLLPYRLWATIFHTLPLPSPAGLVQPHIHQQERVQLWDEVLKLLSTVSQTYPLLFILDDLQWADEESIDLLGYLIHHLQEQRILLIATCRHEEFAQAQKLHMLITDMQRKQELVTLPVHPLTPVEIGALLTHLPQQVAQCAQAQAAGNPFFALELASLAGQNQSQARLPETITALFERRLSKLSQGCQACLGKAAQFGETFDLNQLLSLMDSYTEEDIFDLLEEALHARLLKEEGTAAHPAHIMYHFCHPLLARFLHDRRSTLSYVQESFKT